MTACGAEDPAASAPPGGNGGGAGSPATAGGGGGGSQALGCATFEFALPAGRTLLVIGQDTVSIDDYIADVGPMPGGVMVYTNVHNIPGFADPVDFGTGEQHLGHWEARAEPFVLQLAVSLKAESGSGDNIQYVLNGRLNPSIDSMAERLRSTGRPVLLRFGYEFDNPYNGYEASSYADAFRYVVDRFRTLGVLNVAFVWHAWGYAPMDVSAWYPDDAVVDLIAVSVFPGTGSRVQEGPQKRQAMAQFARARGKPLMIAESAPQAVYAPSLGQASWDSWYAPLFDFVESEDVAVLSYINANWNAFPVWAAQGVWGDTRVQGTPVEPLWRQQVSTARFVHSSDGLYAAIGCH